MEELFAHILEQSRLGYSCSQIIVRLALDLDGAENPGLVRAVGALGGGIGGCGMACGCLTGGACAIGYFVCKGEDDEPREDRARQMVAEFVAWFQSEIGRQYGSCDCDAILEGDPTNKQSRCPRLVEKSYLKAAEILEANGFPQ